MREWPSVAVGFGDDPAPPVPSLILLFLSKCSLPKAYSILLKENASQEAGLTWSKWIDRGLLLFISKKILKLIHCFENWKLEIENFLCGPRRNSYPPACRQAGANAILKVDLSGIEPEPQQCECRVIPFYYKPNRNGLFNHFHRIYSYVINRPVLKLSVVSGLHLSDFINDVHTFDHFTEHCVTIICIVLII